jgi:hypothetical protein
MQNLLGYNSIITNTKHKVQFVYLFSDIYWNSEISNFKTRLNLFLLNK